MGVARQTETLAMKKAGGRKSGTFARRVDRIFSAATMLDNVDEELGTAFSKSARGFAKKGKDAEEDEEDEEDEEELGGGGVCGGEEEDGAVGIDDDGERWLWSVCARGSRLGCVAVELRCARSVVETCDLADLERLDALLARCPPAEALLGRSALATPQVQAKVRDAARPKTSLSPLSSVLFHTQI